MIMTKEKELLKAQELFQGIQKLVEDALQNRQRIDLVEREVMHLLLQVGLVVLRAFVAGSGDDDVAAVATPPAAPSPPGRSWATR